MHNGSIVDLDCPISRIVLAMMMSAQAAALTAIAAAVFGRYSSPVPTIPPQACVCRCDGDGPAAEVPSFIPTVPLDLSGYAVAFGLAVGIIITLLALRCWSCVLESVRESLAVRPTELVRPRFLVPPLGYIDRPRVW